MKSVFQNILINALQAVGYSGYIHVRIFEDTTNYVIQIEDSGAGISQEHMEGMMDDKGKLKLKGVSPKMLKRMKQEFVDCPVLKDHIHFIQCFVCPNFQSRVTGKVLCKGDKLK